MVIVNTVVIVRDRLGMTQQDVALTLAAYGFGSMAAAFILPRILDRIPDRRVMLLSAAILVAGLDALAWIRKIGRAHVLTPVTNAQLVCRLRLEKNNNTRAIH